MKKSVWIQVIVLYVLSANVQSAVLTVRHIAERYRYYW
jgi:hypothetical protein